MAVTIMGRYCFRNGLHATGNCYATSDGDRDMSRTSSTTSDANRFGRAIRRPSVHVNTLSDGFSRNGLYHQSMIRLLEVATRYDWRRRLLANTAIQIIDELGKTVIVER